MTTAPTDDRTRELLDRVRTLLPDRHLREVRMFGVYAVMVDGAMAVAAHKDGSLLVRVDPAEDAALISRAHAARAEMGNGRSMGEGWIRVDASALRTAAALNQWVQAATRYLDSPKAATT
ncbi:MAG: TfoX/Sxy family protein [Actinomycetota bacterium]|nr:TfoX/Sxy family protein [Actinomycetota bacterium]